MIAKYLRHGLFVCWVLLNAVLALAQVNPSSLGQYVYVAPPGWTATQYSDGIVLRGPQMAAGEPCMISLWPMRQASGNLLADANTAFQQIFASYEPRSQTSRQTPLEPLLVHGTSGEGWEYLIVKRGIGKPSNPPGQWASLLGFVFVAKLGSSEAVVSGMGKDPLVSACFGELVADVWPKFFYSLHFRNWSATDQSAAMRQRMAGTWTIATATVADRIAFAPNGRYASAAAAQQYNVINNSTVATTTQAYFGDGAYSLRGNAIVLTPDDKSRRAESGFIRVEQESKDEGRTWKDVLFLMRTSTVDGKEYEVRYRKN